MEPAGVEPDAASRNEVDLSYFREIAYSQRPSATVTLTVTPHSNATNSSIDRPAWRISARSVPFLSSIGLGWSDGGEGPRVSQNDMGPTLTIGFVAHHAERLDCLAP
jgi:hypothetical protein